MSEKALRRRVLKALKPLCAKPVENPACPGTPDVAYIDGWVELKKIRRWPKDSHGKVIVHHFTPQQRIWLQDWCTAGGEAWLLLQVGRNEFLLFWGEDAANKLGKVDRLELLSLADVHWRQGLDETQLRARLGYPPRR